MIDPDKGKVLFTVEHELRNMKHPIDQRAAGQSQFSTDIMRYALGSDARNWTAYEVREDGSPRIFSLTLGQPNRSQMRSPPDRVRV
jgi:hypothetical protein